MESSTKKVVISRNVIFNESAMLHDNLATNTPIENTSVQVEHSIGSDHTPENENIAVQNAPIAENSEVDVDSSIVKHSSPVVQPPQHSIAIDRPRRSNNPPQRFIEECNIASYALSVAEEIEDNAEPSNYAKAITYADCKNWMTAMQDEMQSLEKNCTWELVNLPKEKKTVRCKWIFKRKKGISLTEKVRYKARLCKGL